MWWFIGYCMGLASRSAHSKPIQVSAGFMGILVSIGILASLISVMPVLGFSLRELAITFGIWHWWLYLAFGALMAPALIMIAIRLSAAPVEGRGQGGRRNG